MQVELFKPSRDSSRIRMRGSRKIEGLQIGETVSIVQQPSALRLAILRACAAIGSFDNEYLLERAADYTPSTPRHRVTRVA